ncbi:MAG: primosomal protein N', partial [Acidobacteria bacterium]
PAGVGELARRAQAGAEAVRRLAQDGLLCVREIEIEPPPLPVAELPTARPETLTDAQREAVAWIGERLARGTFHQAVLFGVTGSGKTEVYLRAAERALAAGRPVIFLVPEIGLTPQVARALSARFGEAVSVLHSGMNDRQRFRAWRRARDGEARIVVGARSAIFAPVERPGLIVVDEEHDAGYKQEESPRYHARDLALIRGREAGAVVVYGSATPSIECWSRAGRAVAALLELPERVGEGRLPEVEVVDMRREFRETKSDDPLSRRLTGLLGETLARGEQAIVLLNRRGYTRALVCRACGEAVSCGDCSVPMTWHKVGGKLRCHYCAASRPRPESGPACGSEYLADIGSGTQQIEELVAERLDGARVLRLDRDAARSPARLAETLGRFARGEADVLVGTQMVAKGHHFPRVTLVGVLSADAGLWLPDFRAAERTFALLMQVAGRAGRGERPGRVVVQALKPEHPAIASALAHDYRGFAEREWRARRALRYPPAAAMAVLLVRDEDQMRAFERAGVLRRAIHDAGEGHVAVIGPAVAPLARLRGEWRVQLIVRALKRRRLALALRAGLGRLLGESRVMPRWLSVDVDPVQVM